jgi:hypothetical protein
MTTALIFMILFILVRITQCFPIDNCLYNMRRTTPFICLLLVLALLWGNDHVLGADYSHLVEELPGLVSLHLGHRFLFSRCLEVYLLERGGGRAVVFLVSHDCSLGGHTGLQKLCGIYCDRRGKSKKYVLLAH